MTTQTVGTSTLTQMPSVNLMPPEIAEAARFRRFQLAMGGVVVLAVFAVGVLYTGARHSVSSARSTVSVETAQKASLTQQVGALQSVSDVYASVAAHKALLSSAMGAEIRWSFYLEDLSLRMPDTVWLTNMAVTNSTAADTTVTTGTSPVPPSIAPDDEVGSISFSGVALSRADVSKWLVATAAEHGWSDPFVTNITETKIGPTTVWDWTGSVYVTTQALSNRYTSTTDSGS